MHTHLTLVVIAGLFVVKAQANLFANPDFENANYTGNWFCREDCCLAQDDDAYSGEFSVLVSDR